MRRGKDLRGGGRIEERVQLSDDGARVQVTEVDRPVGVGVDGGEADALVEDVPDQEEPGPAEEYERRDAGQVARETKPARYARCGFRQEHRPLQSRSLRGRGLSPRRRRSAGAPRPSGTPAALQRRVAAAGGSQPTGSLPAGRRG